MIEDIKNISIWNNEKRKTTDNPIFNKINKIDIEEYITRNIIERNFTGIKHIEERHLNISDKDLQLRIKNERKPIASTYISNNINRLIEVIKDSIAQEIRDFPEGFFCWIFDGEDYEDYDIIFDLPKDIKGYCYLANKGHEWKNGHLICSKGKICLMKTNISKGSWDIRTSYTAPYNYLF